MNYLSRPIDELAMSVRAARCLERLGVKTIGELVQKTTAELLQQPNFGRRSLLEIELILEDMGLSLRPGRFQPQKPQPGHHFDEWKKQLLEPFRRKLGLPPIPDTTC
jgi:DNA-directed RNA polymerase alpha subunit